jgi:hypothetical protein
MEMWQPEWISAIDMCHSKRNKIRRWRKRVGRGWRKKERKKKSKLCDVVDFGLIEPICIYRLAKYPLSLYIYVAISREPLDPLLIIIIRLETFSPSFIFLLFSNSLLADAPFAPKSRPPSPLSSFLLIRKLIGETHLIFGIGDIFVAWGENKQQQKNDFVLCENITTLKMKKKKKITTLCQIHQSREVATALIGGSCCCFFIVSCYSKRERKKNNRGIFLFF